MISRFALRLMMLFALLCLVLASAGYAIGQAQPYHEWDILAFSRWNDGIYLMDTSHKIVVKIVPDLHVVLHTWIPNQRQLLYEYDGADEPFYGFDLTTGAIFHSDFENRPYWSYDLRSIAFVVNMNFHLLDVTTGQIRTLVYSGTIREPLSWSPDNQKIAFSAGEPTNLFTISLADGSIEQLTSDNGRIGGFYTPDWSPSGSLIALKQYIDGEGVYNGLFDTKNYSFRFLSESTYLTQWSADGTRLVMLQTIYESDQLVFFYRDMETKAEYPLFDYQSPYWTKITSFAFLPVGAP